VLIRLVQLRAVARAGTEKSEMWQYHGVPQTAMDELRYDSVKYGLY